MKEKITKAELDAMIASSIREKGVDGIFTPEMREQLKNKIIEKAGANKNKSMQESENETSLVVNDNIDNTEVSEAEYNPELPEMLQKIEPAEIIVFDMNELSHGGEQMSYTPFRMMKNPDEKKSMKDLWLEEGRRKADVYIAKFEKIGEIEFNYARGTSFFKEDGKEIPAYEIGYKENPYAEENIPQINTESPKIDIESYIKNSMDIDRIVRGVVEDILKGYFSHNNEKAIEQKEENPGYYTAEPLKENITMKEIASKDKIYKQVNTPELILKTLKEGVKTEAKLISNNGDVNIWELSGDKYFIAKEPISINKCYKKV